jgi:hypothetical protein
MLTGNDRLASGFLTVTVTAGVLVSLRTGVVPVPMSSAISDASFATFPTGQHDEEPVTR